MQGQATRTLLVAACAGLALSACAAKPKPSSAVVEGSPPVAGDSAAGLPGERPFVGSALQSDLAAAAGDRVFFEVDSHDLDAEAQSRLGAQADWLLRHPGVRAVIAGNCDERGTREYNLALGARRAAAAKALLVSRGVPGSRLDTVSYGKERPIALGSTEADWARNRNAHTVLIDLAPS